MHRFTTADQRVDDPPDVVVEEGGPVFEPIKVLDSRAKFWSGFWGTRDVNTNPDWLKVVRLAAQSQHRDCPLDPIQLHEVQQAIAQSPPRTGVGADLWRVREWHVLPEEAKGMLTEILNQMEQSLIFPVQALLNVIAMMGKPSGGERPICLTTAIYRLYSRIRKTSVSTWEADKAGFWDSAVRNSLPLRLPLSESFSMRPL